MPDCASFSYLPDTMSACRDKDVNRSFVLRGFTGGIQKGIRFVENAGVMIVERDAAGS